MTDGPKFSGPASEVFRGIRDDGPTMIERILGRRVLGSPTISDATPAAGTNSSMTRHQRKEEPMDVKDYYRGSFLKIEDLNGEPLRATIEKVSEGDYGLVLNLEDGSMFSLNVTNFKTVAGAWGTETNAWIAKEVELTPGQVKFKGQLVDSIILKTISPALTRDEQVKALPKKPDPLDDSDIPF
jgi:hypothetical protein